MDRRIWIVELAQPTVVHDVLRQPAEGQLTVSEKEAERLFDNNLLTKDPERVPQDDDEDDGDDAADKPEIPEDLAGLKVNELKAKAIRDGVALHDATTKPAIIAAFVAHRAAKSQEA